MKTVLGMTLELLKMILELALNLIENIFVIILFTAFFISSLYGFGYIFKTWLNDGLIVTIIWVVLTCVFSLLEIYLAYLIADKIKQKLKSMRG